MEETKHNVFVTGDTHGGETMKTLGSRYWNVKGLTKNDFLIVLGDFGLPWQCSLKDDSIETIKSYEDVIISPSDLYHIKWFIDKPFTTLVLLGNHEGIYSIWDKLEVRYFEPIKGNIKVLPTRHGEVFYLLRDTKYEINGKSFLVIGGAMSIDKEVRTPYKDWWELETLTHKEQGNLLDIIEKQKKFDFVLSHTIPTWLIPSIMKSSFDPKFRDPISKFLEHIESQIEFKCWHFGHFHEDIHLNIDGDNYYCHYNAIPRQIIYT